MSWTAVAIAGAAVVGGVASNQASKKQAGAAGDATRAQLAMFDETQQNLSPYMRAGNMSLAQLSDLVGLGQGKKRFIAGGDYTNRGGPRSRDAFNPEAYLAANPDVDAAGVDPFQHYMEWGRNEERTFGIEDPKFKPAAPGPETGMLLKPFGMEDFKESPAYQFNLQQGQKAIEKAAAKRGNFYAPATLQDISKFSQGMASNEFQNAYSNYNTNMKNIWDRLYSLSGSGQNAAANLGGFGTSVAGQVGENMMGAGNAQAAGMMGGANALAGGVNNYMNYSLMNQMLQNQQQPSVAPRSGFSLPGAGDLNQNYA